mmetsp:Transcript_23192/g.31307  ORF Transcript_23192/g.31307 Transcript_23192/m.31307 type:complete len:109 (+) Transcript_23192:122-448(+)
MAAKKLGAAQGSLSIVLTCLAYESDGHAQKGAQKTSLALLIIHPEALREPLTEGHEGKARREDQIASGRRRRQPLGSIGSGLLGPLLVALPLSSSGKDSFTGLALSAQ